MIRGLPNLDDTVTSLIVSQYDFNLTDFGVVDIIHIIEVANACEMRYGVEAKGSVQVIEKVCDDMKSFYADFDDNGWKFNVEAFQCKILECERGGGSVSIITFPNNCCYINELLYYMEDNNLIEIIKPEDYEVRS